MLPVKCLVPGVLKPHWPNVLAFTKKPAGLRKGWPVQWSEDRWRDREHSNRDRGKCGEYAAD